MGGFIKLGFYNYLIKLKCRYKVSQATKIDS